MLREDRMRFGNNKSKNFVFYLSLRSPFTIFVARMPKYEIMGAINITDIYMEALAALSNEEKLDLISKLSNSMLSQKRKKKPEGLKMFDCFHKDWGGDKKPEDIAEDLRQSRMFNRDVASW